MLNIPTSPRVALLIDADNALSYLDEIVKFSHYYGNLKILRAYGDWKKFPLSASHKNVLKLNINCVQVNRIGKNATDKQLLSEAVKILNADKADIFIIVSGDGHFKPLCEQIRQKGRKVVGIGNEKQASLRLQESCDIFYYIEQLKEHFK